MWWQVGRRVSCPKQKRRKLSQLPPPVLSSFDSNFRSTYRLRVLCVLTRLHLRRSSATRLTPLTKGEQR